MGISDSKRRYRELVEIVLVEFSGKLMTLSGLFQVIVSSNKYHQSTSLVGLSKAYSGM